MKYLDENGLLYYTQKIKSWLFDKVDKVDGKGLSTNDFTTTLKNKLDGIESGAKANVQADWDVTDTSSDAYIKNKPTIPDGAKLYSTTGQNTDGAMTQKSVTDALNNKVDKVSGKGLSTNDFTTTLKNKLDGIESGAEVNVQADWNATSGDAAILNKPKIPPEVTVDSSISDSSTNPVQNKIVKEYVDNAISGVTQFDYEVVTTLPTTGVKGKIYLKAHAHGTGDSYDEYIWVSNAFEKIGTTDIDLSGYVPTTRKVNNKALSSDITLSASDVSAVPTTRKVNNKTLSSDITLSASDVSAVPTTRTINSKALSANITLSASDVGAIASADVVAITNSEIDTIVTTASA